MEKQCGVDAKLLSSGTSQLCIKEGEETSDKKLHFVERQEGNNKQDHGAGANAEEDANYRERLLP